MSCVEKIFLNLNAPPAFNLRQKILGDQNTNLQYIVNETKANVSLRGRGSGFIEPSLGVESSESLHLYIEHPVLKNLIEAKNLARNLLETIQSDLQIFLQTNQVTQQPPPIIATNNQTMTMPSAVLSVPPPNIIQNNTIQPTHIIQQPNFIPQTHIIPQQMQIIQQTPLNIPPPLPIRTTAPISVQFQGQPTNIQIQSAAPGQPILLNQAPATQQYQLQYIPTATAPQTQTIQHFIQPQQQIQGILQPHGQQFITLQGNTAFMIPPPNIVQNPTVFSSAPPITINSTEAVDSMKPDGTKIMKQDDQKNQLTAANATASGRTIVTNINQPPPPIQQFIVNANPWPQNQQQIPLNSQIQILTQQPQATAFRNGNEIVIQNAGATATASTPIQGHQQIITTFNPSQGHHPLQQIQFTNQAIISQPPPSASQIQVQQAFSQQPQNLEQHQHQPSIQTIQQSSSSRTSSTSTASTSLSFQQQFEQKINMGAEYQQQRALKRKIDEATAEAETKGNTFTKTGMGAMTKNRPPPAGHQQPLKSGARNAQIKSGDSNNKKMHNKNIGPGTSSDMVSSMKVNISQVEIMKPPPSTAMPTSTKGDNDFIDTQQQNNFDNIGNQTFMHQPPPNIHQQHHQFTAMPPRGQMIMFQTQPPPSSSIQQDVNNFQNLNQINMTRFNVPRGMMMSGNTNNSNNTNNDVLGSGNFQQQPQQKFRQQW